MRHSLIAVGAAVAALAMAGSAAAQSPSGLRTLSWPGRPAVPQQAPVAPQVQTPSPASEPAPQLAAPTRTETRYSGAPAQAYASVAAAPRANRLTPASAFYAAPAPVYAAASAPYSAPIPQPQPVPQPQPTVAPQSQPMQQQQPQRAPQPAPAAAADPMAPRADAAIFRMGSAAAAPRPMPQAATGAPAADGSAPYASAQTAPPQQGARYYSVHRAAGRAPDPTTLPAPFFLDMAPVDLAEPPAPPQQVRQGGLNPLVADGVDLP